MVLKDTLTKQEGFKNIYKQNVLLKLCLSWWPNAQACLTSEIRNDCQAVPVHWAVALSCDV